MGDPSQRFVAVSPYTPALVWLSVLVLGMVIQAGGRRVLTAPMVAGLAATTLVQIGASIGFFACRRESVGKRVAALIAGSCATVLAPILIPADARVLRFVTSCASVVLVMKLWDLHVHVSRGLAVEWSRFMPYLLNAFAIVLRHEGHGTRPPRRKVLIDLARGVAGTIVGLVAVFTLRLLPWRQYPLLVEHMVKALLIFVSILCWLGAAVAIVRLCGGGIRDFSDAPLLARTPADFWRRYNRVFRQYFHENIFKRAGGRRWPAAATILIFALSGLMHEYVFGIAIGRVQGFQITFFLLQGVAVAATFRVKPRARPAIAAWTAATITFNLLTSLLFFLSFHAIVPLYVNPLPAWLQR